jgi:hypothetical protein
MNAAEIQNAASVRRALCNGLLMAGYRLLPGADDSVLALLAQMGVTATVDDSGLHLHQGATEMVLSSSFASIRTQHPEWFVTDARRDAIASREDFHGSAVEVSSAKSAYISKHGLAAWERLPATRAEAERKSVTPSEGMSRSAYLSLSFHERATLAGIIGGEGIGRILARVK